MCTVYVYVYVYMHMYEYVHMCGYVCRGVTCIKKTEKKNKNKNNIYILKFMYAFKIYTLYIRNMCTRVRWAV